MKSKKTLAIILAIMMILSSFPIISLAADPIALTEKNITVYPTIKNSIVYGQTWGEMIIEGGEVRYDVNGDGTLSDDEIVPGHFEHYSGADAIAGSTGNNVRIRMNFVPEDTTAYSGFMYRGAKSKGTIEVGNLKLVDEENDKPTTDPVIKGTALVDVEIKGGAVVNVLSDAEIANKSTGSWSWVAPETIVNESGYYEAKIGGTGTFYNEFIYSVYVEINADEEIVGPTVYGSVTAWPTIECPEWTKGMTVADLTLKGGEATVEGTFAIATAATTVLKPNKANSIVVTFTPADSEVEMITSTSYTINVTPTFTRKDITVESISPVTIEYGKRLNQIGGYASNYGVTTKEQNEGLDVRVSFNLQENKDAGVYDVALAPGNYTVKGYVFVPSEYISGVGSVTLYNATTVDIPLVVTKTTSTAKFGSVGTQEIVQEDGSVNMSISYRYKPEDGKFGHAVLKVNGETVVDNITDTTGTAYYIYNVRESGTYTATLEYVPAETDYIEFTETVQSKTVDITVDLVEEDPIIPILPGGDSDGDGSGITLPEIDLPEIDLGDFELDTDGDHKFKFVNIIQNLIEMLKNFIKQIGQTIEGIL